MEVGGQRQAPISLPRVERLGNHCTGVWVVWSQGMSGQFNEVLRKVIRFVTVGVKGGCERCIYRDNRSCFLSAERCASSNVLPATLENGRQSPMLAATLYTGFASSYVAQGHSSDATAGRRIFAGNSWLAEARQTLRQALALPRQNYKLQIILANCGNFDDDSVQA